MHGISSNAIYFTPDIGEFRGVKARFKKAEEPEIKLPIFIGSQRKQGNSRKTSTSASWTV